jgi:hypothetical protein
MEVMRIRRRLAHIGIAVAVLGAAGGVAAFVSGWRPGTSTECTTTTEATDLGSFPYHPLAYHLDLSILAYHLYGQSLIWPFDPYYEERAETFGSGRNDFLDEVRDWVVSVEGPAQVQAPDGLGDLRGPGALSGFDNNPRHDPIVYDYSLIHPWSSTVVNAAGRWIEYLTPTEITGRLLDVYVAYRPIGGDASAVVIDRVIPNRIDADADATDILIAFEGGTGDKGEADQPHSQSLLGFVLARSRGGDAGYDLHVAFRGSRSGAAGRAFFQALSTGNATGNPDWITDLGFRLINDEAGAGHITTDGKVARGFATSIGSTLPTMFAGMEMLGGIMDGPPTNIYVTGHSLGGALAQHFTSAVLLGDQYGPNGTGTAMPATLEAWPWQQIKLITFGAPRAGDEDWARPLTIEGLQSEFYADGLIPFDRDALDSADPEIVPRLLDANRPVGYRTLISNDPITNDVIDDGKGVGKTVYVNLACGNDPFGLPDAGAHEPEAIRDFILLATADDRTPETAWRYLDLSELSPDRNAGEAGTLAEFEKLRDAVVEYYADRGLWFDTAAFLEYFDLMLSIDN